MEIEGTGRATFCIGDSIILRTKNKYESYYWFNISNPDSMLSDNNFYVAASSGSYSVLVKDKWGCESIADYYKITVLILNNTLSIQYDASNKIVDFDTVNLSQRTCFPITIYNVSNREFILDDVFLKHNIEFSIPQGQFPYDIGSGDSMNLMICYRPLHLSLDRDTIVINDTCSPHIIPLKGIGGSNIYISKAKNKNCDADLMFETLDLVSDEYFDKVRVYPNPASGIIKLEAIVITNNKPQINAFLYNATGIKKKVGIVSSMMNTDFKGKKLLKFDINFDIIDVESGIYFIELSIGGQLRAYQVSIIK
ncbi:MAG: T9SS type A sorting domain-containing protein [Chlorobi bacterium]|nr:T9SS type A sorting domain-containing protein [Chlorobiota bacterium]